VRARLDWRPPLGRKKGFRAWWGPRSRTQGCSRSDLAYRVQEEEARKRDGQGGLHPGLGLIRGCQVSRVLGAEKVVDPKREESDRKGEDGTVGQAKAWNRAITSSET
jgi:hypothetical protein